MRRGEPLNGFKSIVSTMNMAIPTHKTILLSQAPIVGHGGKGTHYNRRNPDEDMDELFVKWGNGEFESQKDPHVEAVFCGHTHENWIFHDITVDNMNWEKPPHYSHPAAFHTLYYNDCTFYIETTTATKNY